MATEYNILSKLDEVLKRGGVELSKHELVIMIAALETARDSAMFTVEFGTYGVEKLDSAVRKIDAAV